MRMLTTIASVLIGVAGNQAIAQRATGPDTAQQQSALMNGDPYSGSGFGWLVTDDGSKFILFLDSEGGDLFSKRMIAFAPIEPEQSLAAIPELIGHFSVQSYLDQEEGSRHLTITWSDPGSEGVVALPDLIFDVALSGNAPDNGIEVNSGTFVEDDKVLIDAYEIQAFSLTTEFVQAQMLEYEQNLEFQDILEGDGYNDVETWMVMFWLTGSMGLAGSNNCTDCDAGGPGSTSCTITDGGVTFSVACDGAHYACCKRNQGGSTMTAVCCPINPNP